MFRRVTIEFAWILAIFLATDEKPHSDRELQSSFHLIIEMHTILACPCDFGARIPKIGMRKTHLIRVITAHARGQDRGGRKKPRISQRISMRPPARPFDRAWKIIASACPIALLSLLANNKLFWNDGFFPQAYTLHTLTYFQTVSSENPIVE